MTSIPTPPTRLAPLEHWQEDVDQVLARTRLEDGKPIAIFRTLARHPALLRRYNVLGGCFQVESRLDPRDRELVILRVAANLASEYELSRHLPAARRAGLPEPAIDAVTTQGDLGALSEAQLLLVRTADELLLKEDLGDSLWESLAAEYSDAALLELIMLVGFYRMTALLLRTVRVPLD